MRTSRPLLAGASILALTLSSGAYAAPKAAPACNLVKDATGDAEILTAQKSLDIVSGDLGTDAKNVTAVIRLAGAPGGANPQAAGGTRYYFEFTAAGSSNPQYLFAAVPFAGAPTFRTGEVTTTEATRSFSTDPANPAVKGSIKGNVITITAPPSAFERVKIKPGAKLSGTTIETFGVAGVLLISVDEATGKSHTVGSPTCVKPGAV